MKHSVLKSLMLVFVMMSSAQANPSCDQVVVKSFSVFYPIEAGAEKICTLDLSMVDASLGRYPELGIFTLTTATAVERVKEIRCPDTRTLTLVSFFETAVEGPRVKRVFGVFSKDLH